MEISIRTLGIAKCIECGKVFDLDIEEQAADWYYGHDCYIEEEDDASN
jgi:NOL1/NOP2/fmu family ribosome biogenesis protein